MIRNNSSKEIKNDDLGFQDLTELIKDKYYKPSRDDYKLLEGTPEW